MGSTTFLLPNAVPAAAESLLRLACLAGGYDQTPTPTRVELAGDRLVLSRETSESGLVVVPWPVGAGRVVVITSATVRERETPYRLLVELARGKLNQVRSQTGEWKDIGLYTPDRYEAELANLTRLFATAALASDAGTADAAAADVLERGHELADQLVQLYVDQMLATRHQDEGKLGTLLAARTSSVVIPPLLAEYRRGFNAARIGLRWADVEPEESRYNWAALDAAVGFAEGLDLPITVGPVIDLAAGMLPPWAESWRGDLPTLAAFMCDYLETLVGRYKDRVRRWVVCAAGFNHADGLGLTDDDRLRLAARLFEAAAPLDPALDFSLGVAQPFGDYLVSPEQTISPLAFADDLIRAGARVGGIELELRTGTTPRGSFPRDRLDFSRLLDLFSLIGPPLDVVLSCPAGSGVDAAAQHGEAVWSRAWPGGPTPESQSDWGMAFATLALCKPQVRSVTWDHWADGDAHLTPFAGLVASNGQLNPLLGRLQGLKAAHLE